MNVKKLIPCCLLAFCASASLFAQELVPIDDKVYEDIPFPMEEIALPAIPQYRVSIVEFGAVSSSETLNTDAINNAIKHVNRQGGGVVIIPSGMWLTGPIELLSNVRLHAEKNALVLFSPDHSLYRPQPKSEGSNIRTLSPIYANRANNIAITGEGIFDGNGSTWRMVKREKMTDGQWQKLIRSGGVLTDDGKKWYPNERLAERDMRPNMIRFFECRNVLLQGVTFKNSPAWCVHPIHCEELVIHGISVINPWYSQNGDALDIESCNRVLIYDCTIDAGDDAICIKSGKDEAGRRRGWPCRNVVARDNVVYHGHGGFVVGSEMSGGVNNVFIDNCTFIGTDVGIRFKSTRGRGGVVENIYCNRINMFEIANENILFDLYYALKGVDYTKAEPVNEGTPVFRNIRLTNVKGVGGRRAIFFNGLPEMQIQHITMKDISFTDTHQGAVIRQAGDIVMDNVNISSHDENAITLQNVSNAVIDGKYIESVGNDVLHVK